MDQMQNTYDYRQYDRVWQRVSPTLDPYPGMQVEETQPAGANGGRQAASAQQAASVQQAAPAQQTALAAQQPTAPTARMEPPVETLPGAEGNPCCMGTQAEEMLEVLEGFIEEELADRRFYLAFARQAPTWARQALRETGEEEGAHAKRLMAVYYLITGQCYRPSISCERISVGRFCPALRERYHVEACGGFNYARAADGTTDICLAKLLNELSADEYRHAERIMAMLERAMAHQ